MNGGDRTVSRIDHQDRETVGGSNRKAEARAVRNQGVAFACRTGGFHSQNPIGMDLLDGREISRVGPIGTEASAKSVIEPGKLLQRFGAVDMAGIEAKQTSF